VLLATFLGCDVPSGGEHLPSAARVIPQPRDHPPSAVQYILENPAAYVGARLTVGGEIVEMWSLRAFTVIGREFPKNDALLVLTHKELTPLNSGQGLVEFHGASVRVTGRVMTGVQAAERALDRRLSDTVRIRAATGPIFLAEVVAFDRTSDAAQ
jgi:hypothetical protein